MLADSLQRQGYRLVEYGEETDLLVLNTCSVTENAEKDCRYAVRKTLRHSPHAFVAVTGCYAQTGASRLQSVSGIDLIVGTQFKMNLPDYLPAPTELRKQPAAELRHSRTIDREDFVLPGTAYSDSTRALLKVQDGCDFMCSFCLIPFARGRERSRVLEDVLREARELAAHGYRELVLTGVNIGRYHHQGATLVDLLRALDRVPGVERIRISSIEPTTVPLDLLEYMAGSPKVCRYLHLPLQSGDDTILQAMNRRYNVEEYRRLVDHARALMPDLGLGTDLMVGFPGEDEDSFARTVQVVASLPFSYFHVFSYSARPGTAAARLDCPTPPGLIRRRSRALAELSRAKTVEFYQRYLGQTLPILFEQGERAGFRTGTSGHFMKVAVPARLVEAGSIHDVTITGVTDGLAYGRLADPGFSTSLRTLL
ncbi:MAG: Threonylcarbamoyladenosine tRNA methylthiotransferase MtaB [Nitrospirae bacterium]|nr:MAG: putative tRNA modifying enzyme, MiaB-like [Nitrospira sp. OLB3]MBV6469069.1 Threonylcarbamoyladenosine tRNA methylthiotransferase MtaB [Nitrospirota bacterium]MCK6493272.1 tRNA (N(6)-L-threonylcarbamoyladenosine(37)-C(2))-methylthiotransferase MtaB [Nitrospira sp.]